MFNIGTQELLVILVLALVVVGPQKLPELARSIGRGMREFRKMQDEVKDMMKVDLNPEPPSVHQPGVSGTRSSRQPHRTSRPAAEASPDATADDGRPAGAGSAAADDEGGSDVAPSPSPSTEETSAGRNDGPDEPPAAAGAG